MTLSLSILGIFLSVILLYFNARNYTSSIYLGLFFLLISIYNFIQYVMLESKSVFGVSIVYLNIGFLTYLIGPMLYWYVRSVLTDDPRLKKSDFWHLLPMLIFFMATLPHLFSPWSHKVGIASKIVVDVDIFWKYKSSFLNDFFNPYAIYLSRPILVLGYAFWSFALFLRYLKKKGEPKTQIHQHLITKWLSVLFLFLTIWFVGHALQIVETAISRSLNIFYSLNILQFLSATGLIGLLVLPFFFPAVLYGLSGLPKPIIPLAQEDKTIKEEPIETDGLPVLEKKVENRYEADYLLRIHQKVELCMKDLQPYLRPDCNLAYLSKLVDVPGHHLSHYFREEMKQPFNDYRNEWRVNHAKKLITEGKTSELTLEAIGHLSGFSSRNAFFMAFKKVEEISPSAFAAQFII